MEKIKTALKITVFAPLIILLLSIALPLALIAGIIGAPFAAKRKKNLELLIADKWLPRKKYVYVGYRNDISLANFIDKKIIPKYGKNIVWDMWDEGKNEWVSSEPDNTMRITTIWQDIGGDYDDDPVVFIGMYCNDFKMSKEAGTFHAFYCDPEDFVFYESEKISYDDAEKKIEDIVKSTIAQWSKK